MKHWRLGFAHKGLLSYGFVMVSVYRNCSQTVPVYGVDNELTDLQNDMKILSKGDMNCIVTCFDENSAATQEGVYAALALENPPVVGKSLKCVRFRLRDGMPALEPVETSTVQSVEKLPGEHLYKAKIYNSTYICAYNPK